MLEDVYEPTQAGWVRYSAGKWYKLPQNIAEVISKQGYGCYVIKPEELK